MYVSFPPPPPPPFSIPLLPSHLRDQPPLPCSSPWPAAGNGCHLTPPTGSTHHPPHITQGKKFRLTSFAWKMINIYFEGPYAGLVPIVMILVLHLLVITFEHSFWAFGWKKTFWCVDPYNFPTPPFLLTVLHLLYWHTWQTVGVAMYLTCNISPQARRQLGMILWS